VLDVVAALIDACAPFGRAREWFAAVGADEAQRAIATAVPGALRTVTPADVGSRTDPTAAPVGVLPQAERDVVAVGAVPYVGRLHGATLDALARLARDHGGEVRTTPWRGVVLPGVAALRVPEVVEQCGALGLVCDPKHPANSVVACAGRTGCASGQTDALGDARRLVDALVAVPFDQRPALVHVSGCEKGCAHPGPAPVTLVGRAGSRYDVVREGTPVAAALSVPAALREARR
jgi:precorrin-3B synthase